jgi:c-di-GMP-binding flagellar brake protein YcgR
LTSGLIIESPIAPRGDRFPTEGEKVKVSLLGQNYEIVFTSVLKKLPSEKEKLYSLPFPPRYTLSRRKSVRLQVSSETTFRKILLSRSKEKKASLGRSGRGRLLNLSGGGVLLETSRRFKAGELLLLNLSLDSGGQLRNLLGEVKRVEEYPEGERVVGIKFSRQSDLDPKLAEALSILAPAGISDFGQEMKRLTARLLRSQRLQNSGVEVS